MASGKHMQSLTTPRGRLSSQMVHSDNEVVDNDDSVAIAQQQQQQPPPTKIPRRMSGATHETCTVVDDSLSSSPTGSAAAATTTTSTATIMMMMIPLEIVLNHVSLFLTGMDVSALLCTCKAYHELYSPSVREIQMAYLNHHHGSGDRSTLETFLPLIHLDNCRSKGSGGGGASGRWSSSTTIARIEAELIESTQETTATTVTSILLPLFFEYNRQLVANKGQQSQFVAAGGAVLNYVLGYDHKEILKRREKHAQYSGDLFSGDIIYYYPPCDIDIFIIGTNPEESHSALRNILHQFHKEATEQGVRYAVSQSATTFNIVPESASDTVVQIILRRIGSIHELLTFFDLDCSRFAFDGVHLYSNSLGLRAITTGVNILDSGMHNNALCMRRAAKYRHRGIVTIFQDHPLHHLFNEEMIHSLFRPRELQNAIENPYSKHRLCDSFSSPDLNNCGEFYQNLNRRIGDYGAIVRHLNGGGDSFVDGHRLSLSIAEVYALNRSILGTETYNEEYIAYNYLISRCEICKQYFASCSGRRARSTSGKCKACNSLPEQMFENIDLRHQVAVLFGCSLHSIMFTVTRLLQGGAKVVYATHCVQQALSDFQMLDVSTNRKNLVVYPLNLFDDECPRLLVEFLKLCFGRIHIVFNGSAGFTTYYDGINCVSKLDVDDPETVVESSLAFLHTNAQARRLWLSACQSAWGTSEKMTQLIHDSMSEITCLRFFYDAHALGPMELLKALRSLLHTSREDPKSSHVVNLLSVGDEYISIGAVKQDIVPFTRNNAHNWAKDGVLMNALESTSQYSSDWLLYPVLYGTEVYGKRFRGCQTVPWTW